MKIHYQLITLLLFLCSVITIRAEENYMFKHIETKDGLSHSQINAIYKDSRGFMWFGTAGGGLNRYDGYNFKVFRRVEKKPNALPDNYIHNIQEDNQGRLWIGTGSGYTIYDPVKEVFTQSAKDKLLELGIDGDPRRIYIDDDKNIWVYILGKGVFKYQPINNEVIHFPLKHLYNMISMAVSDTDILFLFSNGEIIVADKNNPEQQRIESHVSLSRPVISEKYAIYLDRDGDWWVYSKEAAGVWWYNVKENSWQLLNKSDSSPLKLSSNVIQGVTQDQNGRIWLATDHGGIDIIDKKKGELTNLQNDIADNRSLSYNSINCVYCDDLGIVWIGTYKKGLSYYNEAIFKFSVDHLTEFNTIPNFDCDITIIGEDQNGDLWLGTNGNGLIHINRKSGKKTLYSHDAKDPNSISSNTVVSLHASADGKLWIGTYYGGLDCFDGKKFTHYRHQSDNPNSVANDKIWSIAEDKEGNIWIGTLGDGIQKFNTTTKTFPSFPGFLFIQYISTFWFAQDGTFYVGAAYGLVAYST